MIPFPNALLAGRAEPREARGLTLDFAQGVFSNGAVTAGSVSALPGYAFERSGEQGAVDSDGSVGWFAPDAPAINGRGFHAYGSLGNLLVRSQEIGQYPWTNFGGVGVTADAAAAPDGTATAEGLAINAGYRNAMYQTAAIAAGSTNSFSVFVRKPSGGASAARVTFTDAVAAATGPSAKLVLTGAWQRLVLAAPLNNQGAMLDALIGNLEAGLGFDPDCAGSLDVWQAQLLPGNFPDGGPLIRTGAAAATIGSSDLRVGLANGDYSATFTFDDGSSQTLALTVADGQFRHPVAGTLNRPIVRTTSVVPA